MYDLIRMIILFFLTICFGILASMVGIGGGAFLVPAFVLFLGMPINEAIGTSLFTIIFISLSGSLYYLHQKRVDIKTGLIMESTTIPGAILGAATTEILPAIILKIIFFLFLFFSGVKLFTKKDGSSIMKNNPNFFKNSRLKLLNTGLTRKFVDARGNEWTYYVNIPVLLISGFFAGFLSGLLGIGGGTLKVPIFTIILGMPTPIATATATFMIFFTSLSGGLTHLLLGNVYLEIVAVSATGAVMGAQIGARINVRLSEKYVRKVVGVVLMFVASLMLYSAI